MTIPAEQQEIARYLSDLSGGPPRETHISAVFIGTDTVWKLKKAVRMPFLDFSTVDARAHFLQRELALNKTAAPGLYRDVVAVSRRPDGSLELGGDNAIDWVLRMAVVPADDFLDVIASKSPLTPQLLDALGGCVAAYHENLAPVPNRDSAGGLLRITQGNRQSALAAGLPIATVENWYQRISAAIESNRDWLAERSVAGCVRRCHGDLHLGNLCLWNGKPVAFDALEFDEDLATIDVGYDLGFLLMDLDQRVGRPAANRVMNRYVARTGDIAMRGFPVFLSQRAMIRAHVLAATHQDGAAYLAAAQTYLDPIPPMVVAIGGLQGTGKSTLARAIAPALGPAPGALIVRSDEIRKRLHGAEPEARLPPEAYTEAANSATNAAVIDQARNAAASGHAVIVDATFLDTRMRRDLAAAVGVPFLGIWLHAPLSLLESRIASRAGDASDATVAVLHRSLEIDPGAGDWRPVDASDGTKALAIVREAIDFNCQA
ncbi:bifunctional aminoglycoside phosphotransferase/ATP-binding protein [Acidisphaera sp. S103]|uniref:bifunctional aminoglycoside phosphotransferase/ATP-binding protein n=1 Tax=Acidisphaera sp. S103 TaxID=1747223 RepID=UPI001C207D9F|nr:bifunctional aminoglycoside phosphotransferase/ATP-binding protein [Acidisphaera sp. S103]